MSVFVESGIEFDFTTARNVIRYDDMLRGLPGASVNILNSFWPGVDFIIEDAYGETIWLEVKNWNLARFPPHRRGGQQRSFVSKMRRAAYAVETREKFLGTSAFFAWHGLTVPPTILFALLFEPPRHLDTRLLASFGKTVNSQIMPPNVLQWRNRIRVAAVTLAEWNARFPDLPAQIV